MGGAFVGVADDWTAIYWNPAGLARLKGKEVGASLEYVRVLAHDSQGLVNAPIPFTQANFVRGDVFSQFGGEPAQFNGQDSDFSAWLPSLGFYASALGMTFGGGSYSPLGFAFEVKDNRQPGFDVSFKSQGYLVNHNLLSVAKTILPGVNIGAGVNLVQARLGRFADKKAPGYESSASAKATALGVQGVFGTLLDLGKRVHVGGVYRTGQDIKLKGDASVADGRFPPESSAYTQTIRNPTTYGVGVSVLPLPSLTLSADWQRTEWNATREDVQFDNPGLILQNQSFDLGWASTSRYRFGMEWRPSEWSFRFGTFRDPRAVSFASQGLTGLIDPDIRYYTSGFSYRRPCWEVSLTNQYGAGTEVVNARTLRKEVNSFVTEFDYFF